MTNAEARRNDKIRVIRSYRRGLRRRRRSGFISSFVIRRLRRNRVKAGHSSFRAEGAVTIIELLIVIVIILILAALILAASSYVQTKGARARAETEIAAMSAALESYKADNGIYPRDNPGNKFTDTLDARINFSPAPSTSPNPYTSASL